jgi:hypothetical protein
MPQQDQGILLVYFLTALAVAIAIKKGDRIWIAFFYAIMQG